MRKLTFYIFFTSRLALIAYVIDEGYFAIGIRYENVPNCVSRCSFLDDENKFTMSWAPTKDVTGKGTFASSSRAQPNCVPRPNYLTHILYIRSLSCVLPLSFLLSVISLSYSTFQQQYSLWKTNSSRQLPLCAGADVDFLDQQPQKDFVRNVLRIILSENRTVFV